MTTATLSSPSWSPDGQPPAPAPAIEPIEPRLPPVPAGTAGRARALVARALLRRSAARLPIRLQAPDGTTSGGGTAGSPILVIRDEDAFYRRLGSGTSGLAEAYMAGAWDCDDLPGLIKVLAENITLLVPPPLQALRRAYVPEQPAADDATIGGARHNIERHYDLSDDLFASFLDPSLTYSSALYAPGDTLASAQRRKIDTLLDRAGVGQDTTVLEIGTGWGELAIRAASRGARVTTITLSSSQWATASRRAQEAGVADRIDLQLSDYRQVTGHYDVIVSVEMLEAVGARYWPAYFTTIERLLNPGGRIGVQVITMPHDRMVATKGGQSWIHQYIFPGGQIPSIQAINDVLRDHTGLRVTADYPMGEHYARTLAQWRERFLAAADEVGELGFGPVFRRMWNLYLAYSEGGFLAGYLDVHQLVLEGAVFQG